MTSARSAPNAQNFDGATGPWQNLGVGGWLVLAGLFLIGAAGYVAATTKPVGDVAVVPGDAPRVQGSRCAR